jgi:hypothetical protein
MKLTPIQVENPIAIEQYSLWELLEEAWRIYQRHFSAILPVVLFVSLPLNISILLLPTDPRLGMLDGIGFLRIDSILMNAINFLILGIVWAAVTGIAEAALEGERPAWQDALTFGLRSWLPLAGTALLYAVIMVTLYALGVIPGIIFGVFFCHWLGTAVLRQRTGRAALAYSADLVKGDWRRTWVIEIWLGLLWFIAILLVGWPLLSTAMQTIPLMGALSFVILDLITAFFQVVRTVFFINTDLLRHPSR